jgi:hypothetical protein
MHRLTVSGIKIVALVLLAANGHAEEAKGSATLRPAITPDISEARLPASVRKANFVAVPVPFSNPTLETGLVGSRDHDVIPSYGAGLQFTVPNEQRIVMRLDYGRSTDSDAWYLAVGQAF